MATGTIFIPVGEKEYDDPKFLEWLDIEGCFLPEKLPKGRFPSLTELRTAIQRLGYKLEEAGDWYVTSDNDYTEVWFSSDPEKDDQLIDFWCRRGNIIAVDIGQSVANLCGSVIAINHSDGIPVLIVPDEIFPSKPPGEKQSDFFTTITHRIPDLISKLSKASTTEALFILSQIRQALRKADRYRQVELLEAAQKGLAEYVRLLDKSDSRLRHLAFELAAFPGVFSGQLDTLGRFIEKESDVSVKTQMFKAVEYQLIPSSIGAAISQPARSILDYLLKLTNDSDEAPPVRIIAAHILARSQPGLLTPNMRSLMINALAHPKDYSLAWYFPSTVVRETLDSIRMLMLKDRLGVLKDALPKMSIAEDAHEAMGALLDYAFFGEIRSTQISSLPESQKAERPAVDESKFRRKSSGNWLYPANPTKLSAGDDLLPFQRQVLEMVLATTIPWMIHSNILEKYGLPPTRDEVRKLLAGAAES